MKKFTPLIFLISLLLFGLIPGKIFAQGNEEPIPCNYTDGSCISIGYVSIVFQPGSPDLYIISVDYQINQGGENDCPAIERIRFNPSHGSSGVIEIGDEEEIIGSATIEVNAKSFDSPGQDRTLTMTIEYVEPGRQNKQIPLRLPEDAECGDITPLPVELTSFKGKVTESGISLKWETASEINNSHFDVERSRNGKTYETIAIVQGRGTTSVTSNYSFTDKLPQKGLNYYRLKQVDFDNTTSYSNTIAVTWDASETIEIALVPNPCLNGDCNIAISNAADLETLVQLKDMTGRVVYSKTVRSDRHLLELPMADLKQYKGLFFLTAATGKQVVRQRILLE
ncbi:T9SS type A sorting domain-containing protein [Pontibacter pudoricolor]|uniref:T9SS type A sorting domain-containing protein n=1 Tax=Pontibacter pudoricolor TaxID=2694930 RepID=UPI0013912F33|nr:T9SS type A sorting domain-containing protein [Pontibacter pudoricolor]